MKTIEQINAEWNAGGVSAIAAIDALLTHFAVDGVDATLARVDIVLRERVARFARNQDGFGVRTVRIVTKKGGGARARLVVVAYAHECFDGERFAFLRQRAERKPGARSRVRPEPPLQSPRRHA